MSDYLGNLVARTLSAAAVVRPHSLSLFEPPTAKAEFIGPLDLQTENLADSPAVILPRVETIPEPPAASPGRPAPAPQHGLAAGSYSSPEISTSQHLSDQVEPSHSFTKPRPANITMGSSQNTLADRSPLVADEVQPGDASSTPAKDLQTAPLRPRQPARTVSTDAISEIHADVHPSPTNQTIASRKPTPAAAPASLTRAAAASKRSRALPSRFIAVPSAPASGEIDAKALAAAPGAAASSLVPRPNVVTAPLRREPLEDFAVRHLVPPFGVLSPTLPSKEAAAAPTIHVTIGRVEVRATPPAASPSRPRAKAAPALKLDDYLRQRSGGGRQ